MVLASTEFRSDSIEIVGLRFLWREFYRDHPKVEISNGSTFITGTTALPEGTEMKVFDPWCIPVWRGKILGSDKDGHSPRVPE